ncbi:DUF2156 domain-containing protein [Helicobacter cetorum]|uniref:DUF2156 domain-containing protein n=1 Tax=Helicobacter cetorum TaxID=138563 RepID=UPI000CF1B720|nr:phosphatidylglycerol lysyltransferase domain-containing protein [Helicobacter cetorum]
MFEKITLEHKDLFSRFLNAQKIVVSDVSFVNCFLWQHARLIKVAVIKDCLVIQTTYKNQKPFYFYPIGKNVNECIKELLKLEKNLEFHSLSLEQMESLKENFVGVFEFVYNRDRSDYVYSIEELIALKGKKYHKKKNHLNQFLKNYPDFVYEKISSKNKKEVLEISKEWFLKSATNDLGLINENKGIMSVLENYESLDLKGGLVRVDKEIVAFSFGEILNENTALIHIEKARLDIVGAYQIINQQLLLNEFSHLTYANREEDLGLEGLRRAKMSYNPVFFTDKYEAVAKN